MRAFFEQQNNNATSTPPGNKREGPTSTAGNGVTPITRVRSNFIPVGPTPTSMSQKGELPIKVGPAAMVTAEKITEKKPTVLESAKKVEDIPIVKRTDKSPPPTASVAEPGKDAKLTEVKLNGAEPKNASKTTTKSGSVPTSIIVSPPIKSDSPVSPQQPSTPKQAEPPATPKSVPTPKKTIPPPSPKAASTQKQTPDRSSVPKSPPTPRKTPTPVKSSPTQKKSVGPLSPTKSTSSRRSSSPFLYSPVGVSKLTPQKNSPTATKPASKASHVGPVRKESTPKSLTATSKPAPRTSVSPVSKPIVKTSPAPTKPRTTATPPTQAKTRPRSALGNTNSPRRFVSQPPTSTSSLNKPSPRLNRSTSLHNLPKTKTMPSEHPPVPPVPRVAASVTSDQDYSHLPAFMRPTQASSGKVVARPTSSMEKRSRSGSFKI